VRYHRLRGEEARRTEVRRATPVRSETQVRRSSEAAMRPVEIDRSMEIDRSVSDLDWVFPSKSVVLIVLRFTGLSPAILHISFEMLAESD